MLLFFWGGGRDLRLEMEFMRIERIKIINSKDKRSLSLLHKLPILSLFFFMMKSLKHEVVEVTHRFSYVVYGV